MGKGYQRLPRDIIQGIQNSDAMALWVLATSMPKGWILRKKWLMNQLGIGECRYSKAVKRLREMGIWEVVPNRGKDGRLSGSRIKVYCKNDFESIPLTDRSAEKQGDHKTGCSETTSTYENKQYKKRINTKPAELVTNENSNLQYYEHLMGVEFPPSVLHLDSPKKIAAIIFKANLSSENIRKVFAEFSASIKRGNVRDQRALFVSLVEKAKANELNLSKEGEENLPPWV